MPFVLRANVELAPGSTEIVVEALTTLIVLLDAQAMTFHGRNLHLFVREQQGNVYLALVTLRVDSRVGIVDVAVTLDHCVGFSRTDGKASSHVCGSFHTIIPHHSLAEISTLVECKDTVLSDAVGCRRKVCLYGETQRTLVQYLIGLVAPRIDYLTVANQTGSSATQRRSYAIAVETLAVVQMERQHGVVAVQFVEYQLGCALDPYVMTKALLTCALQGRAIQTETNAVVLEGQVILALHNLSSTHP